MDYGNMGSNKEDQKDDEAEAKKLGIQLLNAVREKREREAYKLISNGADIHLKDIVGWNCMHYAAINGNIELMKILLKKGANILCQDSDGQTPLHKAASGNIDAMLLLVARGPKIFTLDLKGRFPLEMAVHNKKTKAVELLLMFGSEIALQDWSWMINSTLDKSQRAIVELMDKQHKMASGFKFGGINYDLVEIQGNATEPICMDSLEVSIDVSDVADDLYVYFCRLQVEFTDMKRFISDEGEEDFFSDVFDIRSWNNKKPVTLTFTLTVHSVPRKNERINFISPAGNIGSIKSFEKQEDQNRTEVTVTLTLLPSNSTRFALTTVEKIEKVAITKEAVMIKPEAEPEAEIDIPKDTFSSEGELSLQLVDTSEAIKEEQEENEEDNSNQDNLEAKPENTMPPEEPTLVTSVLDISMSGGQQPNKNIPIKLPIHNAKAAMDLVVLASSDGCSFNIKDWEIIPAKPDPSGKAAMFNISHFSVFAGASKKKVEEDMQEVVDKLSKAIQKIRKIKFSVLTRRPGGYNIETDVIVVCGSSRKVKSLVKHWAKRGYEEPDSSEQTFEVPEGQNFQIQFRGNIKDTNGMDSLPLCFKTNSQDNFRQFQICPKDIESENTDGRIQIMSEEKHYPAITVEVKAKGCLGGTISKTMKSEEPEIKLEEIIDCGVHANFRKRTPEPEEYVCPGDATVVTEDSESGEKDESQIEALSWKNLMNIAKDLNDEEAMLLGMQLKLGQEKLEDLMADTRKSGTFAQTVFKKWRGRRPRPSQVETLTNALRAIGRAQFAMDLEIASVI